MMLPGRNMTEPAARGERLRHNLAAMLKPRDVASSVRRVLDSAEVVEGKRVYLSAYQILDRLEQRDQLLEECGRRCVGEDVYHLAASIITKALLSHLTRDVSFDVVQGQGVSIKVGSSTIGGKNGPSAVFRLTEPGSLDVDHF